LQRGRSGSTSGHGGERGRADDDPVSSPRAEAERRRGTGGNGPSTRPVGTADRLRGIASQSHEGKLRRKARAIPVRSSSEGRTPRARPVEITGEITTGARRRGRQERRGRNMTRRRQLRGWWLVVVGLRRGGKNLENAGDAGGRHRGRPGHTLQRGGSPREVRGRKPVRARCAKTTRWMNHGVGSPNP